MSGNSFGESFRVTTFGESHGTALGAVIDGIRPGIIIDIEEIQHELDRRRPGQSSLTTARKESDRLEVLSGIFEGKTTGAPIALLIRNQDARSKDYSAIKDLFRPGHADFTWFHKYGIRDYRGGGRSSGRETVARVAAGALAKQILGEIGVSITGYVVRIGQVTSRKFDPRVIEKNDVRCADAEMAELMAAEIGAARAASDSVGGIVEVIAEGVPAGWGDPVFAKLDAILGAAFLSIGAVKGIEIGDGFAVGEGRGSETNDSIEPQGFVSNHAGGMLGGISTGQTIVARLAVKPTPSIASSQQTVDINGQPKTLEVKGRHDPCICPRLVPVAEAMMAITLCDAFLRHQALTEAAVDAKQLAAELARCDAEVLRALHRRQQIIDEANHVGIKDGLEQEARQQLPRIRSDLARTIGFEAGETESLFEAIEKVVRSS